MPSGPTSRKPKPLDPGSRAVKFLSNLSLSDEHKGQPFHLRVWQEIVVRRIFGTLLPSGLRQYKDVYLTFGRKQAKTQLAAGIGCYMLLGSGEIGEEIVCAAGSRDQASILYGKAVEMITADPWLDRQVQIYTAKKWIVAKASGNVLKVVSADGRLQHGLNPSTILFDELHTQPDNRLYEALTTAQGTRTKRLNLYITTAGNRFDTVCWAEYQRAKRAQADPKKYPSYLPIIYEASPEDDWCSETTWRKAMPALGDFVSLEYIRDLHAKALEDPAIESSFRQLFLNQWVASEAKWLNRPRWERCGATRYDEDELHGMEAWAGLDLSSNDDITAFIAVVPQDDATATYRLLCRFWIPEVKADERDRKDGSARFRGWAKQGLITLTPGDCIDYDWIKLEIKQIARRLNLQEIRIDPFSGTQIALQLRDSYGLHVEFMHQKPMDMNEGVKYLEVLIKRDRLHHNDNPVLGWMADNAVSIKDSEGNVKISKGKSADKVDGIVALVMAIAAKIKQIPDPEIDEIIIL